MLINQSHHLFKIMLKFESYFLENAIQKQPQFRTEKIFRNIRNLPRYYSMKRPEKRFRWTTQLNSVACVLLIPIPPWTMVNDCPLLMVIIRIITNDVINYY